MANVYLQCGLHAEGDAWNASKKSDLFKNSFLDVSDHCFDSLWLADIIIYHIEFANTAGSGIRTMS